VNTVFLDTVGLLALWERRDQWHDAAFKAMESMEASGAQLVTTPAVLECGNAAARTAFRSLVEEFRNELKATGRLITPSDVQEDQAWRDYRAGGAGEASIVDHLSMVIMRGLSIHDVFTNDRHFKAAGFNTLF
jgi:predicted nucleic acid-binding protein